MLCPHCAYDLRGQTRDESNKIRCPECGHTSVGTASRGEVIAAYRSWLGAFGGGMRTFGARFLDSPAIMRTVVWRYLLLLGSCFVIPAVLLVGSCIFVKSTYERWWSPIDQSATKMDVDSREVEHCLIYDPNDHFSSTIAMPTSVHGNYQTRIVSRAVRIGSPGFQRTARTLTFLLGSAVIVTAPLILAIFVCRLLLALSPHMPASGSFRRAIGMAGYIILPTTIQFWVLGIGMLGSLVESGRNSPWVGASLTAVCGILGLLWTGVILATLPGITLANRDRTMRVAYAMLMLVTYWTPIAIAMTR